MQPKKACRGIWWILHGLYGPSTLKVIKYGGIVQLGKAGFQAATAAHWLQQTQSRLIKVQHRDSGFPFPGSKLVATELLPRCTVNTSPKSPFQTLHNWGRVNIQEKSVWHCCPKVNRSRHVDRSDPAEQNQPCSDEVRTRQCGTHNGRNGGFSHHTPAQTLQALRKRIHPRSCKYSDIECFSPRLVREL